MPPTNAVVLPTLRGEAQETFLSSYRQAEWSRVRARPPLPVSAGTIGWHGDSVIQSSMSSVTLLIWPSPNQLKAQKLHSRSADRRSSLHRRTFRRDTHLWNIGLENRTDQQAPAPIPHAVSTLEIVCTSRA